ncbi:MAG: phosphate ABC transporter permease PstA [Eubacterium sp.]|jgi:phosphate transport system permease protein|nr:phosphate ABC transporter permease PstA [Eubacterium sp.]
MTVKNKEPETRDVKGKLKANGKESKPKFIKSGITVNYKRAKAAVVLRALVIFSAVVVACALLSLLIYIVARGIPNLKPSLFEWEYNRTNVSMLPAIVNTITMVVISLFFSTLLGVFSAIYLVEYARRGSKLVNFIRLTTETLAGIPSIVFGLFGYLIFARTFGFGYSMLGGSFTLSLMILPLIIRTTEESLIAVPDLYREGSFGLGAGKLRTIFKIILPTASAGILSGIILGIGRVVGETAALLFTAGTVSGIPKTLMNSGRTLSVHMYVLLSEGLYVNEAYATAFVLLIMVIGINLLSSKLAGKFIYKEKL